MRVRCDFPLFTMFFALTSLLALAGGAVADPLTEAGGQNRQSSFMRAYGPTDPPYAFWRMCDEFPAECAKPRRVDGRFETPIERLAELDQINRLVNATIEPVTDLALYGVSDYWTLPLNGKGDCEDYVLLKRQMLMKAGWPSSALLITVVRDEKMDGHAILTARTTRGDFILDNKNDEVKLWHKSPYRFVMRQSYLDPKAWVALDPAQTAPMAAIAAASD